MTDLTGGTPIASTSPVGAAAKPGGPLSYIHWGPVVAGAVVAAAILFVLVAFGAAIGLAIASPSPTWRDASVGLSLLSGVWLLFATVLSFGVGAYVTGRVRNGWIANEDEVHLRDGLHGLLTWSLGNHHRNADRMGGRCLRIVQCHDAQFAAGRRDRAIVFDLRARPPVPV